MKNTDATREFQQAVHILNGDHLLDMLRALEPNAQYIVFREALVEGAVSSASYEDFVRVRSTELEQLYGVPPEQYRRKTMEEIQSILSLPADTNVWLWFENDAFCQANLWFVSTLFNTDRASSLWRIFPSAQRSGWKTYDISNREQLAECIQSRLPYTADDLACSHAMWSAYCRSDLKSIAEMSVPTPELFQHRDVLAEILEYRLHDELRDSALVQKIAALNFAFEQNFSKSFWEFHRLHPEYGFGDLQYKRAWEAMRAATSN